MQDRDSSSCSTVDTRGKNVTLGSFPRKELPDRAEDRSLQCKGAAVGGIVRKNHLRPFRASDF